MKFQIFTREKSVYSIWQKMKKKEIPFEEVYDLFAVRIVIDVPPEHGKVGMLEGVFLYYRPLPPEPQPPARLDIDPESQWL